MRTSWLRCLACVGLLVGGAAVRADETQLVDGAEPAASSESASRWLAGADLVVLKPHFSENPAYTVLQSDGFSSERYTATNFEYDLAVSPRIWLEYRAANDIGVRSQFWQFDGDSQTASASPPANGFGEIRPPTFDGVDIATNIPTDRFTANSGLKAYYVDAEVTKRGSFCNWDLLGAAGLRYGSVQQSYAARLHTGDGVLAGSLDMEHRMEGIGPTIALETRRPLGLGFILLANARGSLLYGPSQANFAGGEDLDLQTPFHTAYESSQDTVIPVGELQLGGEWWASPCRFGQLFARSAFEAQVWNGVGNASSLDGNLGLAGFSFGVGLMR